MLSLSKSTDPAVVSDPGMLAWPKHSNQADLVITPANCITALDDIEAEASQPSSDQKKRNTAGEDIAANEDITQLEDEIKVMLIPRRSK